MPTPRPHQFSFRSSLLYPGVGLIVFLLLESLIFSQVILADRENFLTARQMQQNGIRYGLPFLWHFGMWSDFLFISPLCGLIVGRYSKDWSSSSFFACAVLAFFATALLSWSYTFATVPEAHVRNHQLTTIGLLHAVYMWLSLSIFLQFFIFTSDVPQRFTQIVSILLVVHVFVGTHMLLGLIALVFPIDWYISLPLENQTGWLIILSLALVLLWKNYEFVGLQKAFTIYLYWTGNDLSSTEGLFKFLSEICRVVAFWTYLGMVGRIISRHWNGTSFDFGGFLTQSGLQCILILLIGLTYYLGQLSVKQEMAIAKKIFPIDRTPRDWGTLEDRWATVILVLSFCGLYLFMAYIAEYIVLISMCMTVLAINDYRTRYFINKGVASYFADTNYSPRPGDSDFKAIGERRKVIR
jgi:hypothetical protein